MDKNLECSYNENTRLMLKVAEDDIEAFRHLHQRLAPLMMHMFVKRGVGINSAEDLTQKTFMHLWHKRKNYRVLASFEAFLFGITRNILYNEIRRSRKMTRLSSNKKPVSDEDIYKTLSHPEAELYLKELTEALETAKAKLTEAQCQALQVAQDMDIDFQKALKEIGCSKEAYTKRLKRARDRIKENLASFFTDNELSKKR